MIRWYIGAPRGIHTGNPFIDSRVISYGLAARNRLPLDTQLQKPLLGGAMRDVLPECIRNRRRKGDFSEPYFIGLNRRADHIEAMIHNLDSDEASFLDKGVLLRCFREYRMARGSNEAAAGRMTITLAVLNWPYSPQVMDDRAHCTESAYAMEVTPTCRAASHTRQFIALDATPPYRHSFLAAWEPHRCLS